MMTSVDGVDPRNKAAKISEKTIMYIIATEESSTVYEKIFSQIDDKLSER